MAKKKILMVDNDPDMLAVFERSLSMEEDWEFHGAKDSKQAFERIRAVQPDVVVLDCDLGPGEKSGLDILRALRGDKATRHLPVLMLTGARIGAPDSAVGLDLGADDYIRKPVTPPVLLAKVAASLRRAGGK